MNVVFQDSDGEKSDDNLVVDVSNEVSINLVSLFSKLVGTVHLFLIEKYFSPPGTASVGNTLTLSLCPDFIHSVNPCPSTRILPLLEGHHCPPLEKMAWINPVFSKKTLAVQPPPPRPLAPPHSNPKRCHWYEEHRTVLAVWVLSSH